MSIDKKKALFNGINAALMELERPSEYFSKLSGPVFESTHPFTMLSRLKDVKQSAKHHPEGSVWNHTLMVIDEAASHKRRAIDARRFMWAALLHDIGKAVTTKLREGRITAYDHDKAGAKMAKEFLSFFETDRFISEVCALVRWHMQILYVSKTMRFAEPEVMKGQADIREIALLCLCDRLGRGGSVVREDEEKNIESFLSVCQRL